jgi:phospho-N-acetylmuramoyl-pentapeptide-transferase
MIHWFLSVWLQADNDLAAALTSTTARSMLALVVSLLLALAIGPRAIIWLRGRTADPLKLDSPRLAELSRSKRSTPSMGGLFLIGSTVAAIGLFGDLTSPVVRQSLVLLTGFTLLGACDDVLKRHGARRGLRARSKLFGQALIATLVALMLYCQQATLPEAVLRDATGFGPVAIGCWFVCSRVLVMVGMSNAVNLTDGLDGLASGCVLLASLSLAVAVGPGEPLVVVASLIGAAAGFLRFNRHPAKVFMGDTGSLPLGALLGYLAVATGHTMFLLITCGVLLAEAASVVLQVGSYKIRGQRIFLCAPLHHHFQFAGWPETTIVRRFWGAAALCAVLALFTLLWSQQQTSQAARVSIRHNAARQQVLR